MKKNKKYKAMCDGLENTHRAKNKFLPGDILIVIRACPYATGS